MGNFSNFSLFLPFYYKIFFYFCHPPPKFLLTDNLYTTEVYDQRLQAKGKVKPASSGASSTLKNPFRKSRKDQGKKSDHTRKNSPHNSVCYRVGLLLSTFTDLHLLGISSNMNKKHVTQSTSTYTGVWVSDKKTIIPIRSMRCKKRSNTGP